MSNNSLTSYCQKNQRKARNNALKGIKIFLNKKKKKASVWLRVK